MNAILFAALLAAPQIQPSWSRKLGPEAGSRSLAVSGGTLLTLTWDGHLVGVSAATGAPAWKAQEGQPEPVDGPWMGVSGSRVLVAWDKQVQGRTAKSGEVLWRRPLPAEPTSMVVCPRHAVAVVTHRGELEGRRTLIAHALDTRDGRSLWKVAAAGRMVGAGGDFAFLGVASGRGRLLSGIEGLRCADGARRPVPSPGQPYASLLTASDRRAVTIHASSGITTGGRLCVTDLEARSQRCVDPAKLAPGPYPVSGALLKGQLLYFGVSHVAAHNLDPRPDSWLIAWDLSQSEVSATSEPLVASMGPVDAGAWLLSAFGTTGAKDRGWLLDPRTLKPMGTWPLRKAPTALAVDATRAYVATYDGLVYALPLPGAGPAPVKPIPVESKLAPTQPAQTSEAPVWRVEASFAAHPRKAKTSGQKTEGAIGALAFTDRETLVLGGNDDRVRLHALPSGKRLWRSRRLGKDVEDLHPCKGGFAARVYGGRMLLFRGRKRARDVRYQGGWLSGVSPGCEVLLADTWKHGLRVFDAKTGKVARDIGGRPAFDKRGLRVREGIVIMPRGAALDAIQIHTGVRSHLGEVAPRVAGMKMTQVWSSEERLVIEWCGPDACRVEVRGPQGTQALNFDTTGGAWSPSVPSTLDYAAGWLAFHRDGLDLELVRVADGKRQVLGTVRRAMSSTPPIAFSPDGRRLAVGMHPKPWMVTVFAR